MEMSESIINKYITTMLTISKVRNKPGNAQDRVFENQTLCNHDELLYLELSHAVDAGDIGRVKVTFLSWIYMFKVTGKYKYRSQMLQ